MSPVDRRPVVEGWLWWAAFTMRMLKGFPYEDALDVANNSVHDLWSSSRA